MALCVHYIEQIFVIVLIVILILSINKCNSNNKKYEDYKKYHSISDQTFETRISENGEIIASQRANIIASNKEIEKLEADVEELNKVKSKVKVVTKTIIKEVPLERWVHDTTYVDSFKVPLPSSFRGGDNINYNVAFTIDTTFNGTIDSITVYNRSSLYYGYEKWELK